MEHVNPADPHTDMPESQDTAKCDNSSESSDLNDSGYASQPGTGIISRIVTPDTSPKDKHESQTEGRRPLSSSSSLPFSFTLPFKRKKEKLVPMLDREVDELSKSRFQSIKPRFEKLLLENVLKAQKKPGTPYTPMATRIIMMGSMSAKSDNINPPSAYIVVLCRPEQKDVVQRFLRSSMVQDLCAAAAAGDDDTGPLKTAVLGYAPRLRLGIHASVVQVFADHTRVIAATTTIGGNFTSAKQSSTATLCGTPIRLQVSHGKGEGEGEGRMSIATLGGLIKVVTREGDIRVYGLTAGHALWELESGIETETEMETAAHKGQDNQQDSPIDLFSLVPSALADVPVEDEDHEDRNCQNQGSEDSRLVEQGEEEEEGVNKLLGVYDDADTDTFLQGEDDGDDDDDEEDEDYDDTIEIDLDDYLHQDDLTQKTAPTTTNTTTPWSFINSVKIGSVIYPRSSEIDARGASRSNRQGVFDWALIETSTYEANKLPIDAQAKLVLGQRTPGTTGSRPIYLISASGGVKKGWITPDAGSILCGSGSGGEFVDSYMVTMDTSDQGICDGDSGSWVVDQNTYEVHGHLVATDVFNQGYIMPIQAIFADIQQYLQAREVALPSSVDLLHCRTQSGQGAGAMSDSLSSRRRRIFSLDSGYQSRRISPLFSCSDNGSEDDDDDDDDEDKDDWESWCPFSELHTQPSSPPSQDFLE